MRVYECDINNNIIKIDGVTSVTLRSSSSVVNAKAIIVFSFFYSTITFDSITSDCIVYNNLKTFKIKFLFK